jgi:hypothetical protein
MSDDNTQYDDAGKQIVAQRCQSRYRDLDAFFEHPKTGAKVYCGTIYCKFLL